MKVEFSRRIFKYFQASNFVKIRPVVAELFHADLCDSISLIYS